MDIIDYKKLINQVYRPSDKKRNHTNFTLNDFVGHDNIRYFSYGRHALLAGLRCIGVKKGDKILLPSFICRDVLSSINVLDAEAIFYDVDSKLQPLKNLKYLPKSKAIISVNYFGFSQDLTPFNNYCNRTGSVLIEDNAHGLFSRDKNGRFLGVRGDIGIFSLRKTLPLLSGAALVVNNKNFRSFLKPQIEFKTNISLYFKGKEMIRALFPLIRIQGIKFLKSIVQHLRKIRTGYEILQPDVEIEMKLPPCPAPPFDLLPRLKALNVSEEIKRRRNLYLWLYDEMTNLNVNPVFKRLPDYCVPYGFPFYVSKEKSIEIERKLFSLGLESFPWPDLPHGISHKAPKHYKLLRCVRFLW